MASILGTFIYVSLLLINAIAILNEERFLARVGWSAKNINNSAFDASAGFSSNAEPSVKARLLNLISAVRTLLRVPLIVVNVIVIVYELLLG